MSFLKTRVFFSLLLVSISVVLLAVQTGPDATPTPSSNYLLAADVFVRSGPGRDYIAIGALMTGDNLSPVSRNESGDWILIRYRRGFGWIRADLAVWFDDLDALPVIDVSNLTPSPVPGQETATPFFPTETPGGNFVHVNANSAFVRAGPGQTYLRLGQLLPGDPVDAVGRNDLGGWIMIRFGDGFGWIRVDLVNWSDNLESLPLLFEDDLTPTVTYTPSATPTATVTPSSTSTATDTTTPTTTPTATYTPSLTATPTVSSTPTVTDTLTPSPTPSATATPTYTTTATSTSTLTSTATATITATVSNTPTVTHTDTATMTPTATLTLTPTEFPTATPSHTTTVTASPTANPTLTSRATATVTPSPTATLTHTATLTPTPTARATLTATATFSPTSTFTPTDVSTNTPTPTSTSTSTFTPTNIPTSTFTPTPTPSPTATAETIALVPTATTIPPSATPNPTLTPTPTEVIVAVVATELPEVTAQPTDSEEPESEGGIRIPPEAVVAAVILLAVLGYIVFYMRGVASVERYADGFVLENCPVCHRGELTIETRHERVVGIPRARRTVRCSVCRSVLREINDKQWRYAVDPIENPRMYDRYNGRELDDSAISKLKSYPVKPPVYYEPRPPRQRPTFIDDDETE